MPIQLQDGSTANLAGVDATFKALRVSLRPAECIGWWSLGAQSAALSTGIAANASVFSLRNIGANPLLIRRVGAGLIGNAAAGAGFTAAQKVDFGLYIARSWSTSDSGGTAITITSNNLKHRTSLANPTNLDCRISSGAALTAGTRTLDANTLSQVAGYAPVTTPGVIVALAPDNLLQHAAGDYPVVLAQNEGAIIAPLTAFGAYTGTPNFTLYVNLEFAEATSY
jgi:hypothetical protein